MDVDCSSITYDTKPSPVILEAVNKTLERIAENNKTSSEELGGEAPVSANDTEAISQNPDEALSNSLLTSLDPKETSEAELKEAFCRDIDSFSFEFERQESPRRAVPSRPQTTQIKSNKPPLCAEVIQSTQGF